MTNWKVKPLWLSLNLLDLRTSRLFSRSHLGLVAMAAKHGGRLVDLTLADASAFAALSCFSGVRRLCVVLIGL